MFSSHVLQVRPGEKPVPVQELMPPKTEVKTEKASSTATTTRNAANAPRTSASIQVKQEKFSPEKRMKFIA